MNKVVLWISWLFLLVSCFADDSNTTTTASTTTPVSTTTSTSSPAPPTPTVPVYNVKNGTDICLRLQANIQLAVTYFNGSNRPVVQNLYLNSTSQFPATSSGSCGDKSDTLKLQWWPATGKAELPAMELGFRFNKHENDDFGLDIMQFNYTLEESIFPGTNDTSRHSVWRNESIFKCAIGSYFQCMAAQSFPMEKTPESPVVVQPEVTLTLSNLKVEAFRTGNASTFVGSVRECSADYVPNKVVPIVVGICLAAMIIIALITFVVASRRRQRGYTEIS